ncbi:hypothetical protein BWI93_04355 [Siphonobacter sp. BAB-5385]|uniref:hypothetical protein n=1 Tax=Siphonobacter sp. BAB-5385 TaxID=1864822 RepID=UPI000B9E169D|nr:hypothetical protein [Siphonobacter sp. BAB-5385]OZI09390.1 hypothetical protein BWI93_04355 [Siphonobacter sp. BAB-5385]
MASFVRIIALLALLVVFAASTSKTLYFTVGKEGYLPDDYKYGDLYRFTNLAAFKAVRESCRKLFSDPTPQAPVALYAIGDSFMEPGSVDAQDFQTRTYTYTHWNDHTTIHLDTSVRNILLIESVERHFREHLATPVSNFVLSPQPVKPVEKTHSYEADFDEFMTGPKDVRLTYPEERLDNVLFNWPVFLHLREFKAWMNLTFFNRVHSMTTITPDHQHLLLNLDTDSTVINSNFNPVSDKEISTLIKNLNQTYEKYHSLGFDEVYLSIIPNKTTIAANYLGRYNHLIERIQSDPRLKLKVVDAYRLVRPLGPAAYQPGDSHWTCQSRDLWLRQLNRQLLQ